MFYICSRLFAEILASQHIEIRMAWSDHCSIELFAGQCAYINCPSHRRTPVAYVKLCHAWTKIKFRSQLWKDSKIFTWITISLIATARLNTVNLGALPSVVDRFNTSKSSGTFQSMAKLGIWSRICFTVTTATVFVYRSNIGPVYTKLFFVSKLWMTILWSWCVRSDCKIPDANFPKYILSWTYGKII